jgi:hypothetical protein
MSEIKFSPNLFLEQIELNRFKKFLDDDGFRNFLVQNSDTFGLIRKENETFVNGLVQEDIGLTIKINPILAFDKNGKLISNPAVAQLAVPSNNQWYWVKVAYQTTVEEKGTFSIDSSGNLVCTSSDAELLTILRGQPNFPSRIAFTNATNNILEYDVLEVIDNNNAVLQGSFTSESDLKIAVIGTFTPGYVALTSEKYIFQYDSCLVTLVNSNTITPPSHTDGVEFIIARVKNNGSTLYVEDKRNEIWKVDSNYFLRHLETLSNPLLGIEQITYDDKLSTLIQNLVQVAWNFTTSAFSVNLKLNTITISAGKGGRFKAANFSALFTDGDFDGWRLYVKSGMYFKIKTSTLISSNIELVMENLSGEEFFSDLDSSVIITQDLILTPDAEEIEFICTADPASTNKIVESRFVFPINETFGRLRLNVYHATDTLYNIKYRYKHIKDYSPVFVPSDDSVGFYNELQFDSNGNLVVTPTQTSYIADSVNGFIPLKLNPNAYSAFTERIDLGDRLGVDKLQLTNATPLLELKVGSNRQYEFFSDGDTSVSNDEITLSADMFINLLKTNVDGDPCKNGNYFLLHFKQKITPGAFNLRIVTDYVNPTDFTLLKIFTAADFRFLIDSEQGIFIRASFDGTEWILNSTNEVKINQSETNSAQNSTNFVTWDDIVDLEFTTPNDGKEREWVLMAKSSYEVSGNNFPGQFGVAMRIHNDTDNVQLDFNRFYNNIESPSTNVWDNFFCPMFCLYHGTIPPNKVIKVQMRVEGTVSGVNNADLKNSVFSIQEK